MRRKEKGERAIDVIPGGTDVGDATDSANKPSPMFRGIGDLKGERSRPPNLKKGIARNTEDHEGVSLSPRGPARIKEIKRAKRNPRVTVRRKGECSSNVHLGKETQGEEGLKEKTARKS